MFSWSSQADQLWDDEKAGVALVIRQTNELRADLALDASDEVRNAYEAWKEKISGEDLIDAVHTASEANQRRIDAEKADEETAEPGQKPSRRGGYAALRAEYEKALSNVGRAEREAVITAMDEDLKPTFFRRR